MSIPVSNPKANYEAHKDEINAAVARVLASGRYIGGEEVEAFEEEWAAFVGTRYAIGVGSGTDALTMVLRALGIGPGDDVIVPSFTCTATVAPIVLVGATPVFWDVDLRTRTLKRGGITKNTKAIIPVHLYGTLTNMDWLLDFAEINGLWVIEDACQAHGASDLLERQAGSFGIAGCFSHYPTKNLAGLGDGGSITTNNAQLAEKLRSMRQYGWDGNRDSQILAGQSRLDPIQAAILRVKLRYLKSENRVRRRIATHYNLEICQIDGWETCCSVPNFAHPYPAYHQYVLQVKERESVIQLLKKWGVETAVHYPVPVHRQTAYRGKYDLAPGFSNTSLLAKSVLSLPMYPELTDAEVEHVTESVVKAIKAVRG
jgi:dTDP-4-amino-4,6-dideoxygalactose transaminase